MRSRPTQFDKRTREGAVADRSILPLIDALSRAVTQPEGTPLIGSKTEIGLFPPTAAAKPLAEQAKNDGLLRIVSSETRGKTVRELCVITEKGLQFLLSNAGPREILEDFVRILELRQKDVAALLQSAASMQAGLEAMRGAVNEVLPLLKKAADLLPAQAAVPNSAVGALPHADPSRNGTHTMNATATLPRSAPPIPAHAEPTDDLAVLIREHLAEWHVASPTIADCPLPEIYRRLCAEAEKPSIGQFHDALRRLHDDHMIWLHPWTGPLYDLPYPACALLVGHEIAYFASLR